MTQSFLQKFKLPAPAVLLKSILIIAIAASPLVLLGFTVGSAAVYPMALVLIATLALAPVASKSATAKSVLLLTIITACAVWAYGSIPIALVLMAVSALLCASANRWSSHALTMAPVIVIILATQPLDISPIAAGFWALMGGLYGALIAFVAKLSTPARPVPRATALRYAAVLTIACVLTSWVVLAFHLPHGYWLIISLVVVLSPYPSESKTAFWQRVPGTIIGVLLATIIAVALPQILVMVVAYVCAILLIAYTITGNSLLRTTFSTPTLVLLISAGVEHITIVLALERLAWTVLGAIIAVTLAALLRHMDTTSKNKATS